MPKTFILCVPNMSGTLKNMTVSKIYVKVGDSVNRNTEMIEVQSGKNVVYLFSELTGVVSKILVKQGQNIDEDDELVVVKNHI